MSKIATKMTINETTNAKTKVAINVATKVATKIVIFIKQNKHYVVIAFVSLFLMLLYWSITPWDVRQNDAYGHADYFQMIIREKRLPGSAECAQCYQPPLYYFTVVPIYLFARVIGVSHMALIQLFSIFLMQLFLFFSYLFYKTLFKDKNKIVTAFALTAFWPSVVFHSVRVGNDLMLYPLFALGLYFLLRWIKGKKVSLLVLSLVVALSIAVKSGGYVLLFLYGIVFLIKERRHLLNIKKWPGYLWKFSPFIIVILMLFARKFATSADTPWPVENISGMPETLKITNNVTEYVIFDFGKYLSIPFTDPFNYETGSDLYWNHLFKTMIWGDFGFEGPVLQALGLITQAVFLILLIFAFWGIVSAIRNKKYSYVFSFSIFIALICFSILARILSPYVTTGDFRYIFPGLISFVAATVYTMNFRFGFIIKVFSWSMIVLSILFVLSLGVSYIS